MTPRTTVLIPLHRAERWIETIEGNIARLRGVASIVVSDPEPSPTLERLAAVFAADPTVTVVGERPLAPGWVAHCDDLRARVSTEFFAWLPQDDEIDAAWVLEGERALDAHPDAVLAVGALAHWTADDVGRWVEQTGLERVVLLEAFGSSAVEDRISAALRVAADADRTPLGLAFRGVQRRSLSEPLEDSWGDAQADDRWAIRGLVRGPFVHLPDAVYRKRYHSGGAHESWGDARDRGSWLAQEVPSSLAALEADRARDLIARAWSEEVVARAAREAEAVDAATRHLEELVANRDEQLRATAAHVSGLESHAAGLEAHAAALEELAQELRDQADELARRVVALEREHVEARDALAAETRRARRAIRRARRLRDYYESSLSWRITRVLRALARRRSR